MHEAGEGLCHPITEVSCELRSVRNNMNPFYRVRMISNFPACDHEIDLFSLPGQLRDGCNSTGEITTRALRKVLSVSSSNKQLAFKSVLA